MQGDVVATAAVALGTPRVPPGGPKLESRGAGSKEAQCHLENFEHGPISDSWREVFASFVLTQSRLTHIL